MSHPERVDVAGRPKSKEELEHLARYRWAARLARGDVLDIACGTGYGTSVLPGDVVGIDRDADAVALAGRRSGHRFVCAEFPPIPLDDDSFDCAVCFETLEHVEDDTGLMQELRRVVRPDGRLLISSPNADVASTDGKPVNEWHVREYDLAGLRQLVGAAGFPRQAVFCQGFSPRIPRGHRLVWRVNALLGGVSIGRGLLGDAAVHAGTREGPGYWIIDATA